MPSKFELFCGQQEKQSRVSLTWGKRRKTNKIIRERQDRDLAYKELPTELCALFFSTYMRGLPHHENFQSALKTGELPLLLGLPRSVLVNWHFQEMNVPRAPASKMCCGCLVSSPASYGTQGTPSLHQSLVVRELALEGGCDVSGS